MNHDREPTLELAIGEPDASDPDGFIAMRIIDEEADKVLAYCFFTEEEAEGLVDLIREKISGLRTLREARSRLMRLPFKKQA
jgi:hypothetical protein